MDKLVRQIEVKVAGRSNILWWGRSSPLGDMSDSGSSGNHGQDNSITEEVAELVTEPTREGEVESGSTPESPVQLSKLGNSPGCDFCVSEVANPTPDFTEFSKGTNDSIPCKLMERESRVPVPVRYGGTTILRKVGYGYGGDICFFYILLCIYFSYVDKHM